MNIEAKTQRSKKRKREEGSDVKGEEKKFQRAIELLKQEKRIT